MKILGIETSCDETAAAVVEDGRRLLSNVVVSSLDLHAAYGGVVPEIAARSHIEAIIPVIDQALEEARLPIPDSRNSPTSDIGHRTSLPDPWDQIDGIAVTYGAGLGGSLLIGVMAARTLAIAKDKPLYAINHVEGHVYANFLTEVGRPMSDTRFPTKPDAKTDIGHRTSDVPATHSLSKPYLLPKEPPKFPMLALIVSGGHSQLVLFRGHFDYTLLGQTQDDAIGEAFDKVAKLLGLPYPGGPSVGKKALEGNSHAFELPKAKMPGKYDFSFSGIKTAVLRLAQQQVGESFTFPSSKLPERLSELQKADIAAVFQRVAIETVVDKTIQAYEEFRSTSVVIAGGVAASPELRRQLSERLPCPIAYTDSKLCTDNGAMVATLGCYKALRQQPAADPYTLDIVPNLSM